MSLTAQSPQPNLAWQFEGTTTDYVTGITGTVVGTSPTYVTGKYGQAISITNTAGGTPTSNVTWALPSISSSGVTVACWVNATTFPSSGTSEFIAITGINPESDIRVHFNSGTTSATVTGVYPFVSGAYIGATSSTSFTTGTWVHTAITITESSSGSNVCSFYVNGTFVGSSSSATSRPRTFNKFTVGSFCDGLFQSAFNGLVDDLRIYSSALSAAQVQSIYAAQGMPNRCTGFGSTQGSGVGAPLLSRLSAAATANVAGVFSSRSVSATTARSVQVTRLSDNATQDFYADRLGNLLTVPITGQTLQNWLGNSTGNIVTVYDQSSAGQNMTQATAANQPQMSTQNLFQFGPSALTNFVQNSSFNMGAVDGSYTKCGWVYLNSATAGWMTGVLSGPARGNHALGWGITGGTTPYVAFFQNTYTWYITGTTFPTNTWTHLACTYNNPASSVYIYVNGVQTNSNTNFTASFNPGDGLLFAHRIGRGNGGNLDGYLYDVLIFNTALSATDISTIYNSRIY